MTRPCLGCGRLTTRSYCSFCGKTTRRGLGADHRRRARRIRYATTCHICGMPGSWTDLDDPLTADHVVPRADGGRWSELRRRTARATRDAGQLESIRTARLDQLTGAGIQGSCPIQSRPTAPASETTRSQSMSVRTGLTIGTTRRPSRRWPTAPASEMTARASRRPQTGRITGRRKSSGVEVPSHRRVRKVRGTRVILDPSIF